MSPFEDGGVWLRCALHAHTTNSDGELPPDKLVRHYEWAGFDVLAITDHWIRTAEPSTDRLLVIPSTELNAQAGGPEHDAHVLALGLGVDPQLPEDEFASLEETVSWVNDQGAVPYLAHTYWSGLRTDQFEACDGLVGIEVWNAGCELEVGRGDSSRPTTRTIRATTAHSRGRGCAPESARRRRCSRRCARVPSTAPPGR